MKSELQEQLIKDYPELYHGGMYFECGDGWFNIINDLSKKLEYIINSQWTPMEDDHIPHAVQVKEKFGTLRFYMNFCSDEMDEEINKAENESAKTCEICGNLGTLKGNRWVQTLCDAHANG